MGSTGQAWLPKIMPDGKYQGFGDGPSPPGPNPTKKPTKAPTLKPPTKKPVNSPPSDGNCDASSPCGEDEFCNFDGGANIGGFCEWCPDAGWDDIAKKIVYVSANGRVRKSLCTVLKPVTNV